MASLGAQHSPLDHGAWPTEQPVDRDSSGAAGPPTNATICRCPQHGRRREMVLPMAAHDTAPAMTRPNLPVLMADQHAPPSQACTATHC